MHNYCLAVCEDDRVVRDEICRVCEETLKEMKIAYEISVFSNAEELEKTLREGRHLFDLLILDIELDRKTGMELARELRAGEDWVSILFVTGHEEYALEGYEVQPIQFLMKPLNWEKLREALRTDWKRNHRPKTVLLQKGYRNLRLRLSSVVYVETDGNHGVRIFQEDGEERFPMGLSELERLFSDHRFLRCHNSYLVNLEHVREIGREGFLLDQGNRLPISRKYYRACQEAFVSYINQ